MYWKTLKNDEGLTLIELLIVIAILAILATVATVYYVGINSKARDSARRADLYEISTALEVNKTLTGYVPLQVSQFSSFQWSDPLGNAYCIATGIPDDPSVGSVWGSSCPSGYSVIAPGVPSGSFTAWKVCTFLEKPGSGSSNVFCKTSRQ